MKDQVTVTLPSANAETLQESSGTMDYDNSLDNDAFTQGINFIDL